MPVIGTDSTPEEIHELLRHLERDGLIEYIVSTTPLGARWTLGVDGQILTLDHRETVAFLIGNQLTLHWLQARLKERGMRTPSWAAPVE